MTTNHVAAIYERDSLQVDAIWGCYDDWKNGASSSISALALDIEAMMIIRNLSQPTKINLNKW